MTSAPNARLAPEQVLRVREDYAIWVAAGGRPSTFVYKMADTHGVGVETIRRLLRGETFRHVGGAPAHPGDEAGERALAEASAARLAREMGGVAPPPAPTATSSALDRLVAEVQGARASAPDTLVGEILASGAGPADDPFRGEQA